MSSVVVPNALPPNLEGGLSGPLNTITGIGGFNINQYFPIITIAPITPILRYNIDYAVQVVLDVNLFNNKLGTYNSSTNTWSNNSLTLTSTEFVSNITNSNQIVSVGYLSSIYLDFVYKVTQYFNLSSNVPSLFSAATPLNTNNRIFNANDFKSIINASNLDSTGNSISNISGTIIINDINTLLIYACDANIFGNRPSSSSIISGGFKDGDLILISPSSNGMFSPGLKVVLNLALDTSQINIPSDVNNINDAYYPVEYSTNSGLPLPPASTLFTANINNIQLTRYVPLLIILKDFPYP